MKQFFKTRGAVIGAITATVVIITVMSLFLTAGQVNFIQNGVQAVMRPVETGIRGIVRTLERTYDYMHNFDLLEERYYALRNQIAGYQRLAREAEEIREENIRLREFIGLIDRTEQLRYVDAYVLSWDPSNWTSAFTIDRGADFHIAVGDAVITERHELVGRVTEVGTSWATVQTILDPAIRLGGLMGTGVSAVVEGNFALMQDNQLRLSLVPGGETPLLNDTITTSGYGGRIPQGLTIGRIAGVYLEPHGGGYFATIEPIVDLDRLIQIFIVQIMDREE
ncbi:MAG: rod shape-determining protein MreC [Oscillospiraceae bacterium]|nr:rod shape-determining protein MreC [Oscillospiraceae bacterium]